METFLFLLLIIGGEALFSWLKQNKQKPKSPTYSETEEKSSVEEMEVPSSPAEHLRDLLKRYAEQHPEEELPYFPEEIPEEPVHESPVLFEENEVEEIEESLETPIPKQAWAEYQGRAFERRERENPQEEILETNPPVRNFKMKLSMNSVRAGFVWSKILEEPRFKRRWNPMNR